MNNYKMNKYQYMSQILELIFHSNDDYLRRRFHEMKYCSEKINNLFIICLNSKAKPLKIFKER